MKYYIGTSGWSYDHWIGRFYPQKLDKARWLEYYAKYFKTVEVNMTFYRFPFPNLLKSWIKRTPKEFVFTFKAPREITHVAKFQKVEQLCERFYKILEVVKEKLGCVLWQLPPSMRFSEKNLKLLEQFISELKSEKNVFEFRSSSWWNQETYKMLKKHECAFCTVSAPGLPEDIVVTTSFAYFRFHGKQIWYGSNYSNKELSTWARAIKSIKNCKEIYCYFNNDFNAYATQNALTLKKLL